MTNGFYNTDDLSKDDVINLINDAIYGSYNVVVQEKNKTWTRQIDKTNSVQGIIDGYFNSKHKELPIAVIDRFLYNRGELEKDFCEYEICLHYDGYFLYIFVNEDTFKKLVEKYRLTLKDWETFKD